MRVFAVCLLGMLVFASAAMPASAEASRTIYATTRKAERIGDWKVGKRPLLRHAIRVFGQPGRKRSFWGGDGCAVSWYRLGLKGWFANFGGFHACTPYGGNAQAVRIKGRNAKRYSWRTWEGVRIGSSLRALRTRHPGADQHGRNGWWWIKTGRTHIGSCPAAGCPIPILKAQVRHRKVRAFYVWIGAAGD